MGWTEIAPTPPEARTVVDRFNSALNGRDLVSLADLLTDDTVFENTGPAPDGARYVGKVAVLAFWARWLGANPDARFEAEEAFVAGNRVVVRWTYHKTRDGQPWRIRGVDLFTVRAGQIAAKLAYVKG